MKITIPPAHLIIVCDVLRKHLPEKTIVWVFGSRAKNTTKIYADLDLAIDGQGQPLTNRLTIDLAYDFEESVLPYKVDIVDWNAISDSFKKCIQDDRVLLKWNR